LCNNKPKFSGAFYRIYIAAQDTYKSGADPGFQVRREGAIFLIAPGGGRRKNVGGISCEKSLFYAKKSYFLQLRREARKFLGYFV
jgi:hypothetical protein